MTTITRTSPISGAALRDAAIELGPALAANAARHDHDGSFVAEAFDLLGERGYLSSPVPLELGGGGATTEEVAWAQYELARYCSSSALATTMHLHVVLTTAWRWRHDLMGAEPLLRRVVEDGVLVASTGGGDFTVPTGRATRVDGGWEVSGRKSFVSGVTAASLASTWVVTDDGEAIGFGVALDAAGVSVVENWDAPGMRGTGSHDVVFDRVLVRDEQVTARRQPGAFAPVLSIVAAKALTVIAATYLGVAQGARDSMVDRMKGTERSADPGVRRAVGLADQHLLVGRSVLAGVFADLGDDPEPSQSTLVTATLAKRAIVESARAVGELTMDVLGGRAYRRGDPVERAWRDLRAGPYHPLEHELTLRVAADHALDRTISLQ
jgi:alkylation response protein AidB-like acyl-CoA dehydrogenase